MKKIFNYIFYSDYLNNRNIQVNSILISKISDSILIGPKVDEMFDHNSFCRRLLSSSIYNTNDYKKISQKFAITLIKKYEKKVKNNKILEVLKTGELIFHKIIPIPQGQYEK